MNILILGSGGREHALAWAISKNPTSTRLVCAPGNPGMADLGICRPINITDNAAIVELCRKERIEFVIIGPEIPLIAGLADVLKNEGIKAFGPSASASRLEGSKGFTKDLCQKYNIPTAPYRRFTDLKSAISYIEQKIPPIVVKTDGIAAGKGVVVATNVRDACEAAQTLFAQNSEEIIIENYLEGEEASLFILTDGRTIMPLGTAQDHKQLLDGDQGPNTGGMGAYSPAYVLDNKMTQRVINEIITPTINAMDEIGTPFRGLLYAGLMITEQGPKLIEYNARFGDPECQAIMIRLKSDLLELLLAAAEEKLEKYNVTWDEHVALTVVMVNEGYPASYKSGREIKGLEAASQTEGVKIFHAGTDMKGETIVAAGGRVLNVTAKGATVTEARERAYAAVNQIKWPGSFYRKDIGWRAVERETQLFAQQNSKK
ncbi:MAG: phosphoribosylamine--glycine ligase [Alphaproteobacteria bacterium]|nr:phosphoribosylamine--glycine ligase [Alphaproteobacteria bacterium]